jgi:hypothetical protein
VPAYYNEFDPYAAQWLRNLIAENLIPKGDVDERSIIDVQPGDLAGYVQCHFFAGIAGWSLAARLAGWPDGPLSSWESRLRQRLARIGSTECALTWKASVTPAGRPLSRLVPSMRPTEGTVCGLWPTPNATVVDAKSKPPIMSGRKATDPQIGLADVVTHVYALWPTPTSLAPAKNGNNEAGNSAGLVAIRAHAMACWPTPTASAEKSIRTPEGARREVERGKSPDLAAHGMALAGSSATTEKPGALNPEFVCWLMGFPPEWDACAPTEMRSCRRLRRK